MPLLIYSLFLMILGCNQTSNGKETQSTAAENVNRYCVVCHTSQNLPEESLIAPPLEAVKRRYQTEYPVRDTFIQQMTSFVLYPDHEKALMFGAVRRFQIMPKQPIDSSAIAEIAAFIFDNRLDQPDWFEAHYQQSHPQASASLPDYQDQFKQLDETMDLHLNEGAKWIIPNELFARVGQLQAYVNSLKSENSLEDYPIIAQAIRSKMPSTSMSAFDNNTVYRNFQSVLETKIAYLEQSETKEQGEYALLQINQQLLLFDAYFMAKE